jgi:hypothetical protein
MVQKKSSFRSSVKPSRAQIDLHPGGNLNSIKKQGNLSEFHTDIRRGNSKKRSQNHTVTLECFASDEALICSCANGQVNSLAQDT